MCLSVSVLYELQLFCMYVPIYICIYICVYMYVCFDLLATYMCVHIYICFKVQNCLQTLGGNEIRCNS